jgi:flavin prenyltransferase
VHLVMSAYAREVAKQELDDLKIPAEVSHHPEGDMNVPFVSGSARFDAMVIVPCSMATLGRIASGSSDSVLLRAADVFLKERRKLILVPRETPWNLIHARNMVTLLEAGAIVLPAVPSFYSRPDSLTAVVDTVVWRILDQIGLPSPGAYRWAEKESAKTSRKES